MMPLITQVTRDGERLRLAWGDFHVAAMVLAACFDAGGADGSKGKFLTGPGQVYDADPREFDCYPDAPFPVTKTLAFHLCTYTMVAASPLRDGEYTLRGKHKFVSPDGEVLEFLPGDVLSAFRD